MTANKQYFATHKRSLVPINISLADKGTMLFCGSGRVNIEMVVEASGDPATWKMRGTFLILKNTTSRNAVLQNKVSEWSKNIDGLCFNTTVS
jgi:hypothetical protein